MNNIESFFDQLAPTWDNQENHTKSEKLFLLDKVGIQPGDSVLDIACGTGVITDLIHSYSNHNVVGIDISEKMIEIATKKYANLPWAAFQHIDLYDYHPETLFDVAIIYNAYPHFLNPQDLSNKLYTILKPNGRFAILHSLGRKELEEHHVGPAKTFSRSLNSPEIEAKMYFSRFNCIDYDESLHTYYIIGEKK